MATSSAVSMTKLQYFCNLKSSFTKIKRRHATDMEIPIDLKLVKYRIYMI
jgi:hypothetical protein